MTRNRIFGNHPALETVQPKKPLRIPMSGIFEYNYQEHEWYIIPYLSGSSLVMGSADAYPVPQQLKEDLKLNELLKTK